MQSFESIVSNIETDKVDTSAFIDASRTIKRDYLILFTARSGSTWLTKLLHGHLGIPDEYLNPEFYVLNCTRLGTRSKSEFIPALRGLLKRNEVFGIEATSEHIELFGEDDFFSSFQNLTVFHLWRQNQVAQAVSLFKAIKTGYFHSFDGVRPADPHYDGAEMLRWYKYISNVENNNFKLLQKRNISSINIVYENITRDRNETFGKFHEYLGIEQKIQLINMPHQTEKLSSSWNEEAELQFRKDYDDFILETESRRFTNGATLW